LVRIEGEWWRQAGNRDLQMARKLMEEGLYEGTAFHCQQAGEKYLKALLLVVGGEWQRTHSCTTLLMELQRCGLAVPEGLLTRGRKLDLHYIDSRYPNGVGGPPEKFYDLCIAQELMQACEAIKSFVDENLKKEGYEPDEGQR